MIRKINNILLRYAKGRIGTSIIEECQIPLTNQQIEKINRAGTCHHLPEKNKTNQPSTGDKKWILYDNPKCKSQYFSSNELLRSTAKPGLYTNKALL